MLRVVQREHVTIERVLEPRDLEHNNRNRAMSRLIPREEQREGATECASRLLGCQLPWGKTRRTRYSEPE